MRYGSDEEFAVNEAGGRQHPIPYDMTQLDPVALRYISEVLTKGAESHGEDNWRLISIKDHLAHAMYHINEYRDPNGNWSEEDHLVNAACRLLMAVALEYEGE